MVLQTYDDLLNRLSALSHDQLQMPVRIVKCDEPLMDWVGFFILDEDYIDPTGDGCEPISNYCTDCNNEGDECCHNPIIAFKKGDVFLEIIE